MTQIDNAQTILDAGKGLATRVHDVAGVPVLISPTTTVVLKSALDLADERADKPRRRRGVADLQSIASFIEHANRFKSAESAVWADRAASKFVGVLNYHPRGAEADPAWGDHRAVYPCPLSPEWVTWGAGALAQLDQDDFAQFLEDHDRDLAVATDADGKPYPSPSDLMTMAATLEAYSNRSTKRERVGNKMSLSFHEESGVKGSSVVIPRAFCIRIPVFADGLPQVIEVRLRVEVEDGSPTFNFQIHDAGKVIRAAFDQLVQTVMLGTELPVFLGTPEK